ncbi:DUF2069 domain-containing protein [Shewanella woodyi]|uniref:DUF2069 domain-containing protein n=1 Tax=Shewanella woodyi (strain ATCC 51908 / MS32) TaxID=392500 RepID=B1KDQ3_SHEWM|nr:DUF2069 domain-containing protein [Shewanella woodyi]ACA86450.1 conserved hypothetical protein [Shewanella woodyi ATCC 51908]
MSTDMLFKLCRAGYLLLVLLLAGWFVNKGVTGEYSLPFALLWIIPILLPLKGVIQGKPYTYAWGSFIICLYMLHGLTLLYVTEEYFAFALIEVLLLGALLIGFPFYARLRGRELGLGLKKNKK